MTTVAGLLLTTIKMSCASILRRLTTFTLVYTVDINRR